MKKSHPKTIEIVHLHTDFKFVNHSYSVTYKNELLTNKIFYFGDKNDFDESIWNNIQILPRNKHSFSTILKQIQEVNIIIIYSLNGFLTKLVNLLPTQPKIIWLFFGSEYYSRLPKAVYGNLTYKIVSTSKKENVVLREIKNLLRPLLSNYYRNFAKAVKRIDYFNCAFEEEYQFLLSKGLTLPPFLLRPLTPVSKEFTYYDKKSFLILGNNRSAYNNHLDLISILSECIVPKNISFQVLFNYGSQNQYTHIVQKKLSILPRVNIIDSFLTLEEYQKLYASAGALVINGYRQMALGNIYTALKSGTKIYLSIRNPTYLWLKRNDILVYSIENNLKVDVENNNVILTKEEAYRNYLGYQRMADINFINKFQQDIIEIGKK